MPVKLQQLLYFVRVAEEGQMTRAAKSLHLAQPALSQAIAHLESQLGVELLERHPRGVDLTPAGKAFFAKARVALSAAADAELTAQSLTRAAKSMIELGFLGSPPMLDAPELFAAFAYLHPELEVSFRELPFPCGPTATWLEEVDVALCFSPTADPEVRIQPLRVEPRVLVVAKTHRLARRKQLTVEEVLDETFPGTHPAVDPVWAGFWQLDDHRGSPAPHLTSDRAINPHELAAIIASGRAITATPASNAENIVRALTSVVAIPLRGADPVTLSLVWSKDSPNPLVDAIVVAASNLARTGVPQEPPDGA
jgi:DNA-binding transcriptional LysR family regulator